MVFGHYAAYFLLLVLLPKSFGLMVALSSFCEIPNFVRLVSLLCANVVH